MKKKTKNIKKRIGKLLLRFGLFIIVMSILEHYFYFTWSRFVILVSIISLLYFVIGISMLIFLTLLTYWRTRYSGFALESLIDIEDFVAVVIWIFTLIFYTNNFFLILVISTIILSLQFFFLEKPLAWNNKAYSVESFRSDVLLKQSKFINHFEDGYSPRPVFEDLSEIFNEKKDQTDLLDELEKYAKFLSKKGDLIGFSIHEKKISLYLRTTFLQRSEITKVSLFLRKFIQVVRKRNLSVITMDVNTKEMSIKLNKLDYNVLDNRTYHLLAERILNQFKTSLIEFLKGDIFVSYQKIDPMIKKRHALKSLKQELLSIMLLYCVGLLIIGPFMIYYNAQSNGTGLINNLFSAFIWPIFIFRLINYYVFYFGLNPLEISPLEKVLFDNSPIIVVLFFINLFISMEIFVHFQGEDNKRSFQEKLNRAKEVKLK